MKIEDIKHPELKQLINMIYLHEENNNQEMIEKTDNEIKDYLKDNKVDYFIFGHFHSQADVAMPGGSRLLLLKDWISSSPYICFDGSELITDNNK